MKRAVFSDINEFHAQNGELKASLPFSEELDVLSDELKIGTRIIPNRLACQAMEGCDGTPGGSPDELGKRRYRRFAEGGAGLIWFEATAVLEEGRANPRQLWIREENLDDFKRQVEDIKEAGMKARGVEPVVIMQATHSGRYSKPQGVPAPLIAYNNPIFEKDNPISKDRIVSDSYLDRVGEALVMGAQLAARAGFDGVDIKCCHRYLASELLSAYNRDGRYGGSFENRTRLLRESAKGARECVGGDFIVTTRLNVYDGFVYPYGFGVAEGEKEAFDPTEPTKLLQELYRDGMRLVNITMGNPYFNPHVNRPFANGGYIADEHPLEGVARMLFGIAELKRGVEDMKIVSSALTYLGVAGPHVAAAFIKEGGFDIAGFGRQAFAYPDFARDVVDSGKMDKNKICVCCSKCTEIMRKSGGTPGCVIRDRDVYLPIYREKCGENK